MELIIAADYDEMSRLAADKIAAQLKAKPDCVLGLATGSTPIGLYAQLVVDCKAGDISFADATTFNLDEYRGLAPDHNQSYRYFMQDNLFDHVDVDVARTHVPDGANPDAQAACDAYEAAIEEAGGIDLQLLGLGLARPTSASEPMDSFPVTTHVVSLTKHDQRQQPACSTPSTRCHAGVHDGRGHDHEGMQHPGGGQRRRQGPDRP